MHIELFLEEPSTEAFLGGILERLLPSGTTWNPIVFQGKADLLKNLESRLKGYKRWIPEDRRIVVLIDEDRQDCQELKRRMNSVATMAGFTTKTAANGGGFVVLNRIAVEELEAWFFGDPAALARAFPGVSPHLASKAAFRHPDAIPGGTWEALERILQRAGYYDAGLPKIEVARKMARHMGETARRASRCLPKDWRRSQSESSATQSVDAGVGLRPDGLTRCPSSPSWDVRGHQHLEQAPVIWHAQVQQFVHDHVVLERRLGVDEIQRQRDRAFGGAGPPLALHRLNANDTRIHTELDRPLDRAPLQRIDWI
jgi:hypothetical protein